MASIMPMCVAILPVCLDLVLSHLGLVVRVIKHITAKQLEAL